MTQTIDDLDLDKLPRGAFALSAVTADTKTHINDLAEEDADLIRRTAAQISNLPASPEFQGLGAASLEGRVTPGAPVSPTLLQLADQLPAYKEQVAEIVEQETLPFEFPNLAWESIKTGLALENFINDKLNLHIDQIENTNEDISILLALNAELSGVKEEATELSEKAQQLIEQLKGRGITLQGETVGDIKRQTSSHESRLRSEIQIKFTTKVQHLMQQLESMNQILQNIIRSDSKLKEKANQLPR